MGERTYCAFGAHRDIFKATGFCSNCGQPHCDEHAYAVPEGDSYDAGETGYVCPNCWFNRVGR